MNGFLYSNKLNLSRKITENKISGTKVEMGVLFQRNTPIILSWNLLLEWCSGWCIEEYAYRIMRVKAVTSTKIQCIPDWSLTYGSPTTASQVLELQVCATHSLWSTLF
jgi:hypothetical protein